MGLQKKDKENNSYIKLPIMWAIYILSELNTVLSSLDLNTDDEYMLTRIKRLKRIVRHIDSNIMSYLDSVS